MDRRGRGRRVGVAGRSVKSRVRALKKKVAAEVSGRDPSLTWVSGSSGNIVHGRLLSLHVPDQGRPYYKVELHDLCSIEKERSDRRLARKNDVVCVEETDDVSCLRYFMDEIATGSVFDVWLRYRPFRQEVNVMKIVGPLRSHREVSLGKA